MEIKTYEEIFADLPEDASFYDKAFARRTHKAFLNDPKTKAEIVHRNTILNNIKTHLNNDNYGGAFSDATNNFGTLASIGRDEVREFFKTTNFKEPVQEGARVFFLVLINLRLSLMKRLYLDLTKLFRLGLQKTFQKLTLLMNLLITF